MSFFLALCRLSLLIAADRCPAKTAIIGVHALQQAAMRANSALQWRPQVICFGKDTCRIVVDFVFGEAIQTLQIAGFLPDIAAIAEWALAGIHNEFLVYVHSIPTHSKK